MPLPLGGPAGGQDTTAARAGARPPPGPARIVEILSHELRSPITTIHLGTKVLRGAGTGISAPLRTEVVAAGDAEADRRYRLVEDLLAVARHEDGSLRLPARPLLLQHWLPDVIDAAVHADPALRVRFALPPDLPPVLADDGGLAQIMRNLLGNAVRYAPDGMPVEIVVRPPGDGDLELDVLDHGPGVDPLEAERLFEPFYRSEIAETMGSGAGLGLAAARRLARAMGGDVEAHPRDGGGARFAVRLPIVREDDPADDDGMGSEPAGPRPRAAA